MLHKRNIEYIFISCISEFSLNIRNISITVEKLFIAFHFLNHLINFMGLTLLKTVGQNTQSREILGLVDLLEEQSRLMPLVCMNTGK